MEYCSAIKTVKSCHMTMWIYLKGIMLSEISQAEKDRYHMSSFIHELKTRNKTQTNKQKPENPRLAVARGTWWGMGEIV